MVAKKIFYPILIAVTFFILGSCAQDSQVTNFSVVPVTSLGRGIYRLKGITPTVDLIWSPKEQVLAGLITNSPLPLPDCPPLPIFCLFKREPYSEIFIVNLESKQRLTILRTEKTEGLIYGIFWLPDGKHIGYLKYDNNGQVLGTWSINIQGTENIRISQDGEFPIYSHGGTKKAIWDANKIYVVNAQTNQKDKIFESTNQGFDISGLSWSSDDRFLAFSFGDWQADIPEQRQKIYEINLMTNEISQLTSEKFEQYTYPEFSPANNIIAYHRYQPSFFKRTVVIKDLNTNCQLALPEELYGSISWSPDGQSLVLSTTDKNYIVNLGEFVGEKFKETGSICP